MKINSFTEETGIRFVSGAKSPVTVSYKRRRAIDAAERDAFNGVIRSTLSKPKEVRKAIRTILARKSFVLTRSFASRYGRLVA